MIQNQRISVFRRADNEKGYVQAVISSADALHFYQIGFGPSVNDLPELEEEREPETQEIPPTSEATAESEPEAEQNGRGRKGAKS